MKIVKSLKESNLLIKNTGKTIQNEGKEQKGGFISMLSGASLCGNILAMEDVIRAVKEAIMAREDF